MTSNNGWPGKPGVPMNPEEPGYHWVKGCDGEDTIVFWRGHGGDTHYENGDLKKLDHWSGHPMWIAQEWTYLGPCLTPDEAAKREDVKWHEGYAVGVLDVRRGTAFGEPDTHYAALQKRVAELEDIIRAVHRHAKNLAGDRTFDQCITALMWIDDLCRATLEEKKDE